MQFGGFVAVNNLSLEVNEHEIVALIGPNGAGKTTAFNVITGVYAPTNGSVSYYGKPGQQLPARKMKKLYAGENMGKYTKAVRKTPDTITKLNCRTFQNIRLFKALTVFENVLIAKHMNIKAGIFTAACKLNYKEERSMREEAWRSWRFSTWRITRMKSPVPPLRTAAAAGNRPGIGYRTKPPFAGRAGSRNEPAGNQRTDLIYS